MIYKGKWIKDNPKCCQLKKDNHEAVRIVLNHYCFGEFFFIFYELKIATKVCFLLGDDFYVLYPLSGCWLWSGPEIKCKNRQV